MNEAPEAPPHHHEKTGLPWFDLAVPIAVVIISVASLLTSLQSERSMHALVDQNRRLVEAQSTPMLMLDSSNLDEQGKSAISFTLSDVGTGPGQVAWFHLTDDKGVEYTGGALYNRVRALDPHADFQSQQVTGSFLRPGGQRVVFKWPRPAEGSAELTSWKALNVARFGLHGSACYCSMFDECRVTDFGTSKPKEVKTCGTGT